MAKGCEAEQPTSMVFLISSDDEEDAREDLRLKSFESGRNCEEKVKNMEELRGFESTSFGSGVVIDLTSDEVDCVADPSIWADPMHVVVVRKKKRKRSKKKKEKTDEWRSVDVVRPEEPSETIATVDTDAIGTLDNISRAENNLVLVEAMDKETTAMLDDDIVVAEKPLEKIEKPDKDAIGESDNALPRKIEEDVGELVNKDFEPSAAVIDLLYSSSDEVACMAGLRNGEAVAPTTEVRKKKKRSKKKKRKQNEEERDIHVMRGEERSEAITPIDIQAVGILGSSAITVEPAKIVTTIESGTFWRSEYVMSAENHALTVETVNLEATDMPDNFVKAEKLLERMETMDNDATENSAWKIVSKDFVIDLLSSSSDEVEFNTDMGESRVAVTAAVEVNKKKRRRSKKKQQQQKTEEEKAIDVMLAEEPSEAVTTVDTQEIGILEDATTAERSSKTQFVGISENVMRLENHLAAAEAMDIKATGISNNFVEKREPSSYIETTDKDASGTLENPVLQKHFHGPRYFHLSNCHWETCYNCGLEGHTAKNCTSKKQEKPCFVCGNFGHTAKCCTQGQYCYNCRRRGHLAKDCIEKHINGSQDSKICLKCGSAGHEMASCINDYPPDDIKMIQCYVCKSFGHLCCLNIIDTGPREVSCYICGQSGHKGEGCAKPSGWSEALPILCYKCGENGHLARGCAKSSMEQPGSRMGKPATPVQRFSEKGRAFLGYRSTHDYGIRRPYTWRRIQ